jgi:hypothetical protein
MKMLAYIWILSVLLCHGIPVSRWQVKDCSEGPVWLLSAFKWAERSHLSGLNGPMYVCSWQETKTS